LCKTRGAALSNDGRHPFHHQPSLACHVEAASDNRWGHRDATAILIAYRHGLRASELVALRWDDIDFQTGKLHVRRAKGGTASVHPIGGRELRALRRLKRETPASIYVFLSERLAPLGVAGYQRMVGRDCVPLSIMSMLALPPKADLKRTSVWPLSLLRQDQRQLVLGCGERRACTNVGSCVRRR
jgi:hypothetical protein